LHILHSGLRRDLFKVSHERRRLVSFERLCRLRLYDDDRRLAEQTQVERAFLGVEFALALPVVPKVAIEAYFEADLPFAVDGNLEAPATESAQPTQ